MTNLLQRSRNRILRRLDRTLRYFEPFMLIMGVVGPLATLPQLVKVYFTHSQHADGLSSTMWIAYAILAVLWTIYGLVHKSPPIWTGNMLNVIFDTLMVIGIRIHAGPTNW